MKIFAISDLHLSFSTDKPMNVFGPEWENHEEKIRDNWLRLISPEDVVILPGDLSWGLKLNEAEADFRWVHRLPGRKLLFKGNHDLWWSTPSKLNGLYSDMMFLQNTYYAAGDIAVCGTRGWKLPQTSAVWTDHDDKIYAREQLRLRMSLEAASRDGYQRIIAAMHYPPAEKKNMKNGFTEILGEFGVELVIYGHLHGSYAHHYAFNGKIGRTAYRLVSCDYLGFSPVLLAEVNEGEGGELL